MNSILLVTRFVQLWHEQHDPQRAMFEASQQRMRSMLMASLSACLGLLPAALSTGIGSQVQRPLATVVVGGMLIGPVMLLVVAPALQMMFLGKRPPGHRHMEHSGWRVYDDGSGGMRDADCSGAA